ncbi:hypothetical protein AYL99_01125 [Fonsecaea erecta]|uniref:Zn(2)-C6 fungal-type domain-containing protein n=1 Tax=Fonsecaea erecta TaxID=1367422 RepID=A0A179A149_9EURO|nr:hypothetical protein AYL99_01125 [Fonsecaea erecta]OAP65153.1 hypothetical protein AYL99_01125 [Fonsecaea erecta]
MANKTNHVKNVWRACEFCRKHKVRCVPARDCTSANPQGHCQRCADANRPCLFTPPTRTKAKRSDVRIRELERNVEALTALLRNGQSTGPFGNRETDTRPVLDEAARAVVEGADGEVERPQPETRKPWLKRKRPVSGETDLDRQRPSSSQMVDSEKSTSTPGAGVLDVIDSGLLSIRTATELFNRYVNDLAPHRPIVVFPPETDLNCLRTQKPTLALAILAVAAGTVDQHLAKTLNTRIKQVYADRVMVQGEKSLELIQSLLVTANWYHSPESFDELKFYQYLHLAGAMAIYIGLGEVSSTGTKWAEVRPGSVLRKGNHGLEVDKGCIESRRTLLACYLCCASVSLGFHRLNMFPFTTHMAESLEILETSPCAAPTDPRLVAWIRLQLIMDTSAPSLGLNNTGNEISLADQQIQLALKNCSKQLKSWEKHTVFPVMNETLSINYHYFTCILHEIGFYGEFDPEDFKPPYTISKFRPATFPKYSNFTPIHLSSITTCLSSARTILDTMLRMTTHQLRCSPCIVFARMCYAVVLLLKISLSASSTEGALNGVCDFDMTNVGTYLEQLEFKLREIANGQILRSGATFLGVVAKLGEWYRKHQLNEELRRDSPNMDADEFELVEPLKHLYVSMPHTPPDDGSSSLTTTATGSKSASAAQDTAGEPHRDPFSLNNIPAVIDDDFQDLQITAFYPSQDDTMFSFDSSGLSFPSIRQHEVACTISNTNNIQADVDGMAIGVNVDADQHAWNMDAFLEYGCLS